MDAISLSLSDETLEPARADAHAPGGGLSPAHAERIADEHDIPVATVEAVAEALN